jgi:hypothetical protein
MRRWPTPTWCWCTSGTTTRWCKRIGEHRTPTHYRLLFHDTHHRSVTEPQQHGGLRPAPLRRRAGLRQRHPRPVPASTAGASAPGPGTRRPTSACSSRCRRAARRRPGLDRQLGRRGAHRRTARVPARPGQGPRAEGAHPRRALSGACAGSLREAGIAYGNWLPNHEAPAVFARYARHGARAAPALRAGAAGHPDHPRVRGAGLRHPAGVRALGRLRGPVRARRRLPGRARRRRDARAPARRAERRRLARSLADHGRRTILARHTCAHRVDELLAIYAELAPPQNTERKVTA